MEVKEEYTFEDIDKMEEELQRVIYIWRRYQGKRASGGKLYNQFDFGKLQNQINDYFKNPANYDDDTGKVLDDQDFFDHYGYKRGDE